MQKKNLRNKKNSSRNSSAAATKAEQNKKLFIIKIVVLLVVTAALSVSLIFSRQIERLLNINYYSYSSTMGTAEADDFKLHYIDVGQGDSTLLQFASGENMLIDSGPKKGLSKLKDYLSAVFDEEEKVLDVVIATHSDADHIDNMPYIFSEFKVNKVYLPKQASTNSNLRLSAGTQIKNNWKAKVGTLTYAKFLNAVDAEVLESGCEVEYYEQYETFDYGVGEKLATVKFYSEHKDSASVEANDFSPVLMVTYQTKKFLFTGDAESAVEKEVSKNETFKAECAGIDVYKAGHHGSGGSSIDELLSVIAPKRVVISCEKDNSYGHPNSAMMQRLEDHNVAEIFRTDEQGNVIIFASTKSGMSEISATVAPSASFTNYIEWYMAAVTIWVVVAALLFAKKQKKKKVLKNIR